MTPEAGLNFSWLHCSKSTLLSSFTVKVHVLLFCVLKAIFHSNSMQQSSPPACSQGQTAVSLHCDTWVIQGQSLNGAAKARVLWLVHGIHAWGTEKQKTECTPSANRTLFIYAESTDCTYCTSWWNTTCTGGVLCSTTCPIILEYLRLVFCCVTVHNSDRVTAGSDCRWEHFLPAKTMALAGLNPGRASTGCSWR